MTRGRSNQSQLLVAANNLHLFVWCPALGADSYGATLRFRRDERWTHLRLLLMRRNPRRREGLPREGRWLARKTLTAFEVSRWVTENGTRERVGLKQYVRVKVGPGGRHVDPLTKDQP